MSETESLIHACDKELQVLRVEDGSISWNPLGSGLSASVRQRLETLAQGAMQIEAEEPPPELPVLTPHLGMMALQGLTIAMGYVGRLRTWARNLSSSGTRAEAPITQSGRLPVQSGETASIDARALALFIQDSTRRKKDIAQILGMTTQSLCPARCPKLDAARSAWRAPERRIRGTKDRDGNLEAYDEDVLSLRFALPK